VEVCERRCLPVDLYACVCACWWWVLGKFLLGQISVGVQRTTYSYHLPHRHFTHATLFEVAGTGNRIYCKLGSNTLMNTLTLTNSKARSIQTPDRAHAAIEAPKYSCDHDLPFLKIVRFGYQQQMQEAAFTLSNIPNE
jgi:hypothetical protein